MDAGRLPGGSGDKLPRAPQGRREESSDASTNAPAPGSREKPLAVSARPVPRTNTRGQGEYPEASEITAAKELCKMPPQVSEKGGPGRRVRAAGKWPK